MNPPPDTITRAQYEKLGREYDDLRRKLDAAQRTSANRASWPWLCGSVAALVVSGMAFQDDSGIGKIVALGLVGLVVWMNVRLAKIMGVTRWSWLAAGTLALALALFPPWTIETKTSSGHLYSEKREWAFVLNPPPTREYSTARADFAVLLIEWSAVAIAAGTVAALHRKPRVTNLAQN